MKPPLKWVGGKTQLLPALFSPQRLRGDYASYHEPFLGGGSVMCALLHRQTIGDADVCIRGTYHASDANPALIGFYMCLQTNVEGLLAALRPLCTAYAKAPQANAAPNARRSATAAVPASLEAACESGRADVYYWARHRFNHYLLHTDASVQMDDPQAAALCLFLNKTGFRGVYRTSKLGYNVPYGHYANPSVYDEAHLRHLSALLKPVVFRCESFETALTRVGGDALVYADPPYVPLKTTSFVGYTNQGFDAEATTSLFALCEAVSALPKTRVVLSNSAAPAVLQRLETMESFVYTTCSCRRAIHSKNPAARATEVLAWSVGGCEKMSVNGTEDGADESAAVPTPITT